MKKLNYILILLITLSLFFVVSCGEKSDDHTPPRISDVRFNVNDTVVFYLENEEKVILELNDSLKGSLETDILTIGRPIRFRGYFTDDVGLSTAYINIWGDSIQVDVATAIDTCYQLRKLIGVYMFGNLEHRTDSIGISVVNKVEPMFRRKPTKDEPVGRELAVRSSGVRGVKDKYYFNIRCVDIAGNEDRESYNRKEITILSRDSIRKRWEKDPSLFRRIENKKSAY